MRRAWFVLASLVAATTATVTPAQAWVICPVGIYNMEMSKPLRDPVLAPIEHDVTGHMELGDCRIDFLFESAQCHNGAGTFRLDTGLHVRYGHMEWIGETLVVTGAVRAAYTITPNPLYGDCATGQRFFLLNGSTGV